MSAYTPRHCATVQRQPKPGPGPLALFFRRALRLVQRKPAVPAKYGTAGAAAAPLDTSLLGDPVLGNDMIAKVRDRWNDRHDGTQPSFALTRPVYIPSEAPPTGELPVLGGQLPRRTPGASLADNPPDPTPEQMRAEYFGQAPEYGQAPQLVVEPGLAKRVIP